MQRTVFVIARSGDASFSKSGNLMIEVGQVSDMCTWVCVWFVCSCQRGLVPLDFGPDQFLGQVEVCPVG